MLNNVYTTNGRDTEGAERGCILLFLKWAKRENHVSDCDGISSERGVLPKLEKGKNCRNKRVWGWFLRFVGMS